MLFPPPFRSSKALASVAICALLLQGCDAGSLAGPEKVDLARTSPIQPIAGPTHEMRLFVDASGEPIGIDVRRIRSLFRPNFKAPPSDASLGRLDRVPERARVVFDKISKYPDVVRVSVHQRSRDELKIARSSVTGPGDSTEIELPTVWHDNPEAFPAWEHEAYVDAAINEMVALGDQYLNEYAVPEDLPALQASMTLTTESLAESIAEASIFRAPKASAAEGPNCGPKKVLVGVAATAVVGAVAAGTVAMATAAAPVTFTLGGIVGTALPSASSVILTHVGALAGIASAGGWLGAAFADLMDCLRN